MCICIILVENKKTEIGENGENSKNRKNIAGSSRACAVGKVPQMRNTKRKRNLGSRNASEVFFRIN